MIVTGIFIFTIFRIQAINTIENSNKISYAALAHAIVDSLDDHFIQYFHAYEHASGHGNPIPSLQGDLKTSFERLASDTPITRIKIYDRNGKVIYSTKPEQIGKVQKDNPGFIEAINGSNATKLLYRDSLNILDEEIEDANLLQSYVPIKIEQQPNPIGVFEIYADVNELVEETNRTELLVLLFTLIILAVLYTVLIF